MDLDRMPVLPVAVRSGDVRVKALFYLPGQELPDDVVVGTMRRKCAGLSDISGNVLVWQAENGLARCRPQGLFGVG